MDDATWRHATSALAALARRDVARGWRGYIAWAGASRINAAHALALAGLVALLVGLAWRWATVPAQARTLPQDAPVAATAAAEWAARQDDALPAEDRPVADDTAHVALPAAPADLVPGVEQWWPAIVSAVTAHPAPGLTPRLIGCMMGAESRGRAGVSSPAGALGLMQIMPATARGLGLTVVEGGQDDRLDPAKNIDAGVRYIGQQLTAYKALDMALVAYNGGGRAVARYRAGTPFTESRNYLAAILPCAQAGP